MLAIYIIWLLDGQARMQEVGMGGSNLLNSRSQTWGSGGAAPATVAYLTKGNPENPLLTHIATKCN